MEINNDYFSKLESKLLDPNISDYRKIKLIGISIADFILYKKPDENSLYINELVGNTIACAFNCALNRRDYHAVMSDLRALYRDLKNKS